MQIVRCAHCGSESVNIDASARWNREAQEWELWETDETNAFCVDCDGETSIEVSAER